MFLAPTIKKPKENQCFTPWSPMGSPWGDHGAPYAPHGPPMGAQGVHWGPFGTALEQVTWAHGAPYYGRPMDPPGAH